MRTASPSTLGGRCRLTPPPPLLNGSGFGLLTGRGVAMINSGACAIVEVSDDEIASAIRTFHEDTHNLAEGAGAAALAGLAADRERSRGRKVAVILSGGNIDRPWAACVLGGGTPSI